MTKTFNGYEVTDDGRVISKTGRELSQRTGYKGYKLVTLHDANGNARGYFIHRLVAMLFVKNENPGHFNQVNHIDGDTGNNHADNLEWCDCAYNMLDRRKRRKSLGLPWCTIMDQPTGDAKPVEYDGVVYSSLNAMARHFGVCKQSILEATRRGFWRKKPITRRAGHVA